MALIFAVSGDTKSMQHSSRMIEPFVRWLLPAASEEAVQATVFFIRKCAHVTEYALLTVLVWWALRAGSGARGSDGAWRATAITGLIVVLYAATDEFHQAFVPTRQGTPVDVLIDSIGVVLALLFLNAFARWPRKRLVGGDPDR